MSRKQILPPFKMYNAVSLGATVTSTITSVAGMDKASIYFEWSAGTSPVGTLTVHARNGADGTWRELNMGSTISISGASGAHDLVFNELPFTDIKLVYTRSSGTGTVTATIAAKTVGA